jgi:hypothetical protein
MKQNIFDDDWDHKIRLKNIPFYVFIWICVIISYPFIKIYKLIEYIGNIELWKVKKK